VDKRSNERGTALFEKMVMEQTSLLGIPRGTNPADRSRNEFARGFSRD